MKREAEQNWIWSGVLTILMAVALLGLATPTVLANSHTKTVTLQVKGMVCPLCEKTVESVLKNLDGVMSASADRHAQSAWVEYDPAQVTPEQMIQAINSQTYYRASLSVSAQDRPSTKNASGGPAATAVIRVAGMTDNKIASQVTQALSLDGILDGSISLPDSTLTVKYDSSRVSADEIVKTLAQSLPFTVSLVSVQRSGRMGIPPVAIGLGIALLLVGSWPVIRRTLRKSGLNEGSSKS